MKNMTSPNSQIIVKPEVNVVASTAEDLRKELRKLIKKNHTELVIDLAKVNRIDSVGMGVFIATYNALMKKEKKLKVVNASPKIRALFQTMGLTRRFVVRGKNA
jgi:anti-anti-sigma factor